MIDIRNADCVEGMEDLPADSIDLIVTDPPYTTPTVSGFGRDTMRNYGDLSIQKHFFEGIKEQWERILGPDGNAFVFCDQDYYPILFEVFYDWGFTQLLVWDKGRIGMGKPFRHAFEFVFFVSPDNAIQTYNDETYSDILQFSPIASDDRIHGAQKPVDMLRYLISGFCPPNGTVLDPFIGSGSTAVAAKQLGRSCIGFEINEDYHAACERRLSETSERLDEFGFNVTEDSQQKLPTSTDGGFPLGDVGRSGGGGTR